MTDKLRDLTPIDITYVVEVPPSDGPMELPPPEAEE